MLIILSIGHTARAHLNPTVTIALAALSHFPWVHVPVYTAAQVSGSICAVFLLRRESSIPSCSVVLLFHLWPLARILHLSSLWVSISFITAVAIDTSGVSVFLHSLNSKKCKGVQIFGGGIIKWTLYNVVKNNYRRSFKDFL